MAFNQKEYINNYKKEHYSKLSVDLPIEKKQELNDLCKKNNITIKQFVLDSIEKLKQTKKE